MSAPLAQARAALAEGNPRAALELAERDGVAGHLPWTMLQAQAHAALGQVKEAKALLRTAGDGLPVRLLMARLLVEEGQPEAALRELTGQDAATLAARTRPLLILQRMPEARAALRAAIPLAAAPQILEGLFHMAAPLLGEGPAHEAICRRIAARLEALAPDPAPVQAAAALRLRARLHYTLGEMAEFREAARIALAAGAAGRLAPFLQAALDPPAAPRPRVFVVGLAKTGTSSMDAALARLGFLAAHWANPLTNLMLRPEDAGLIEALSDMPMADVVEELAASHPDARFILTLRPLESWLRSMSSHYARSHSAPDLAAMRDLAASHDRSPNGARWRSMHRRLYTRYPDLGTAYGAHSARVAAVFRDTPGRLLRFDVVAGDGYPKLCAFLGLPAPAEPFPHSNAAPG